jgi:hypothetical protein
MEIYIYKTIEDWQGSGHLFHGVIEALNMDCTRKTWGSKWIGLNATGLYWKVLSECNPPTVSPPKWPQLIYEQQLRAEVQEHSHTVHVAGVPGPAHSWLLSIWRLAFTFHSWLQMTLSRMWTVAECKTDVGPDSELFPVCPQPAMTP